MRKRKAVAASQPRMTRSNRYQLYRGRHARDNAPPSRLIDRNTARTQAGHIYTGLQTNAPRIRQKTKFVFFYKTPMLIKAENSTKSDLHSFKCKMNRGQSLKKSKQTELPNYADTHRDTNQQRPQLRQWETTKESGILQPFLKSALLLKDSSWKENALLKEKEKT